MFLQHQPFLISPLPGQQSLVLPRFQMADTEGKARVCQFIFQFSLLVMLASLMFFTRLSAPLLEPEEARYAEIPRQMLAVGHFVVPMLHGETYYHKPPLLYWLVMASYQIFGVQDWAARLIPGMAGVLIVLLINGWGRHFLGNHAAFLSALILCLIPRFIYLGRMLTMDIVLCLWVVAALLAFGRALLEGQFSRRWWVVSSLCCGLGILTKGPVALALVIPPVLLLQMFDARLPRPTFRAWCGFIALACGIAAPWYVAMFLQDWEAAVDFFWFHNLVRYVAPFDHVKPFWFYLPTLFFGTLPWSLLLIPLVKSLFQKRATSIRRRPAALNFLLLAFLWCLVFYSCSGCKRAVYILPALPMLAMTLGCYLAQAISWEPFSFKGISLLHLPSRGTTLAFLGMLALLIGGIALSLVAVAVKLWDTAQGLVACSLLLAALVVACYYGSRLHAPAAWGCCALLLFLLQLGAICELLPSYNRRFALRGQVQPYLEMCADHQLPVLCYPRRWDSISFYLQHDDVRQYSETELKEMVAELKNNPVNLVFIKSDESLRQFLVALPGNLEFVPFAEQRPKVRVGIVQPRGNSHASKVWALSSK